jgi:membrane-bound lytic murein transglycosylase D
MKLLLFTLLTITSGALSAAVVSSDSILLEETQIVATSQGDVTTTTSIDDTPDSVIIERLQRLPYIVELPYNPVVRRYIVRYLKSPRQVSDLLRRQVYYMPTFLDVFAQYDLPYELAYLPVIESGLNPNARSHMGAVGLWQFMPGTGKKYGLEINSLVDERRDPIKSTHAAARFMQALYSTFQDWNLVIAAYNCGPGNVNKAIYRAGGKRDFWSIYPFLPQETRVYLPLYIAAVYSMNYAYCHGISPRPESVFVNDTIPADSLLFPGLDSVISFGDIPVDTIMTSERIHLRQIAECINIPIELLRQLNPQYPKDIVPGSKDYAICLPLDKTGDFILHQDTILTHRADELINTRRKEIELLQKTSVNGAYSVNGVTYYKIKEGDTLGAIALKFKVSVKQIKAWNGMTSDFIRAGKTLKILVP